MFHARGGRAANHPDAGNVEGKFNDYTCINSVSGVPHVLCGEAHMPASSWKSHVIGMPDQYGMRVKAGLA